MKSKVAVIMGSDSDWQVMKRAKEVLDLFQVEAVLKVVSAHRTPEELATFAREAETQGVQVIIAGAGGAAHLPGMIASYSALPVVGVPIPTTVLQGLDSLLSIVQMPEGIPVATMAIGNAGNAALFAIRILALQNAEINTRLLTYREEMAAKSKTKTANLK